MSKILDELLAPVTASSPCGTPRAGDAILQQVAEAAREDDPHVNHGSRAEPCKRADWGQVAQLCGETLAHGVKDLRLAGWLGTAWVRQRGVAGLADAARLMAGVVARYWDGLYPDAPDGDQAGRLDALAWFDRQMDEALGSVQVAAAASPAGRLFTLDAWTLVLHHEQIAARGAAPRSKNLPPDPGQLTRQDFAAAVSMTPADFYRGLLHQLRDAQDALAHLALELKLHLGAEAPRMGAIASRVARCCQAMQELAGLGGNPGLVPAQEENDEDAAARAAACAGHGGHWPRNRQDAYRLLAQIAEYLLYTEPHSPAPYLVKRAVAWGDMSPAELVQEICDSEGELKRIDLLLGTRGR